MDLSWLLTSNSALLMVAISSTGIYIALLLFTRTFGVRSFSKMSSFDFAMTVAIGSVIATTILTDNPPLLQAIAALGSLFILQMIVATLRNYPFMRKLVDNSPILLMNGIKYFRGKYENSKSNP
ncbi:hypothetical protein [Rhodohalobacter sp.]|uniref:DUF421 domain-containing protein n=1 Tax=Rhodohalobacter sp. TaxID=1974210 RepID=UPI002ACD7E8B|nr:hypothetical protein [Rhodohalobacter sp.]MDZ7755805.1 hypothetical protein [Rhodohalobacter sp.]